MHDVVVIGGGIGGLAAALRLAGAGLRVVVLERAGEVGGKMRTVAVGEREIDAGPTVLTMRPIFEALFEAAGRRLDDYVRLQPLDVLARHAWPDGSRLDLFADIEQSAAAIERFAGATEADGYRRFCAHAKRLYERVESTFIFGEKAGVLAAIKRAGLRSSMEFLRVDWHRSLWRALGDFFADPRLRQLFARYATYYGSSPFDAPGTLALIAHVEQSGVWTVDGGMIELARALRRLIEELGGEIHTRAAVASLGLGDGRARGVRLADGTVIEARAVISNVEPRALVDGTFGPRLDRAVTLPKAPRSLSAVTWSMLGRFDDFEPARHNVFFSDDYRAEFEAIFDRARLPQAPTVYVCAQDRPHSARSPEPLFCLVNAPAIGDRHDFTQEIEPCQASMLEVLRRCGTTLTFDPSHSVVTTPNDFDRMFPGSGGALYGPATHGAMAPFARPGSRSSIAGLYLVGGGVHPGAGVPMVAHSGRLAADRVIDDLASTSPRPRAAMRGGTSTASATTDATRSP